MLADRAASAVSADRAVLGAWVAPAVLAGRAVLGAWAVPAALADRVVLGVWAAPAALADRVVLEAWVAPAVWADQAVPAERAGLVAQRVRPSDRPAAANALVARSVQAARSGV